MERESEREKVKLGKKLSIEGNVITHFKFERFWINENFLRRKNKLLLFICRKQKKPRKQISLRMPTKSLLLHKWSVICQGLFP